MSESAGIRSVADFYAHALAIEREAAERYQQLADQMLTHHNRPSAEFFDRLARMETDHLAALQKKVAVFPASCSAPRHFVRHSQCEWARPGACFCTCSGANVSPASYRRST